MHNRSKPKLGLACAGGVVEGAFFEVGVLCALEDAIEGLDLNQLDVYVGVSAGAIITSCLANGIPARTISRAVVSQAGPLLNIRPEMLFTPALGEYLHRIGRLPHILASAFERYLMRPFDISLFGATLGLGAALPVGIFDNRPIERYLARAFSVRGRTNDFRRLRAELRAVAVNLDTSELVVFGNRETAHVPISRAVQASAALPVLYAPVLIDGEYYIDGVARRTLHASHALAEGVDLLFCVNPIVPVDLRTPGDDDRRLPQSLVELGLPAVLSQTFRTMIHSRMRTAFKNYEYAFPGADTLLIEPELNDHSMFFTNIFSFTNRYRVTEHAYQKTLRYLRQNSERLQAMLAGHGLGLRWEVLGDAQRRLFPTEPVAPRDGERWDAAPSEDTQEALERLDHALDRLRLATALRQPQPPAQPAPQPAAA